MIFIAIIGGIGISEEPIVGTLIYQGACVLPGLSDRGYLVTWDPLRSPPC